MTDVAGTKQSTLRTALAGLIGTVLEWFDFAVYGYFASNIGHQFFPQSDPAVQTFLAYATFALGFFARPIGSIVLGRVGDAGVGPAPDLRQGRHHRAHPAHADACPPGHLTRR